eukprot:TRINITY_DN63441_c0_g1_i1.p1 TRINITY_DN63441_c0_g1~~TRINITY_DN63441_c0_g1_i1.p1  ORF type:complete len:319 (+),score=38.52 TRINITY_DN63441_c0_g1_i1:110-1066(+)
MSTCSSRSYRSTSTPLTTSVWSYSLKNPLDDGLSPGTPRSARWARTPTTSRSSRGSRSARGTVPSTAGSASGRPTWADEDLVCVGPWATRKRSGKSKRDVRGVPDSTDLSGLNLEEVTKNAVVPPWGPERANLDNPPRDRVEKSHANYHMVLDRQAHRQNARDRREANERRELASTSLDTTFHRWGVAALDSQQERAVFEELVSTAAERRRKKLEEREAERRDFSTWADASEREQAALFHMQQARRREECERLAEHWRSQASEKKRSQDAEKAARLAEERGTIARITEGMVPRRRMRRGIPDRTTDATSEVLAPLTAR